MKVYFNNQRIELAKREITHHESLSFDFCITISEFVLTILPFHFMGHSEFSIYQVIRVFIYKTLIIIKENVKLQ